MFDPLRATKDKAQKAQKKKGLEDLKAWTLTLIPEDLRPGLIIDVNEVVCGDPSCAPIDTFFTLVWETTGKGVFAMPNPVAEISREDLESFFPDREILEEWKAGKRARWPRLPALRFELGDRVECRIGPHPVKGWAPGRIIKLYYSEPNWPPNMIVPYQIALHDGRLIFAPQDTDQVIRLRPPAAPDAPSSPEYVPQQHDGEGDDDDNYPDYEDSEDGGDGMDEEDEEEEGEEAK